MEKINTFWFRRDLRLTDNTGLLSALKSSHKVLCIFIFDIHILKGLPKHDPRVSFIYETLEKIRKKLINYQSDLGVFLGDPQEVFEKLILKYQINAVYTNRDYEPEAIARDKKVCNFLTSKNIAFINHKDQVIFEQSEVVKKDGTPYVVYTPYKNKWRELFNESICLKNYNLSSLFNNLVKFKAKPLTLNNIGFKQSEQKVAPYSLDLPLLSNYKNTRDFPAKLSGTSKLGPHLRFGTISIRQVIKKAILAEDTFLNELIWREFFMQILWHFPHTVNKSFRAKYDYIQWSNNHNDFERWQAGMTGYPLVDAGMRELISTGYMHNRVRMLTASFLTKHLLIDWRWGEAYFARKLLDYEQSSNVGNWQWAAGSGVDAAPYFRIFNPHTQALKFDNKMKYIKTWVPEYESSSYCSNIIIDHKTARSRCLEVYKNTLG